MPDNGAQMYTFQLDSEAADKVNDGHYKVTLSPPLELPLLAEDCTETLIDLSIMS